MVYQSQNNVYLTLHRVENDTVGCGEALSEQTLEQLVSKLARPMLFLGENVLYQGRNTVVWFEPAQPRVMFFDTTDPYLDRLSGGVFPQPPLVFMASGRQLNVWALPQDVRPYPNTPLGVAPYYNVSGGNVCMGRVALPEHPTPGNLDVYSNLFWSSAFTHGANTLLTQQWGGSYGQLWEHVRKEGVFPLAYLRDAGKTLQGAACTS